MLNHFPEMRILGMRPCITALVDKTTLVNCCIHCDCLLPVRKIICVVYRSAGVKRWRTTALDNYMFTINSMLPAAVVDLR